MDKKVKLLRLKYPHYTTGDSQKWTYEYTWEDWEAFNPNTNPIYYENSTEVRNWIYNKLYVYFIRHPEKLLEGGYFCDSDVDTIRTTLKIMYYYSDSSYCKWFEIIKNIEFLRQNNI